MDQILNISPVYRWMITLALVAFVVVLSVTPGIERPEDSIFSWLVWNTSTPVQKALHIIMYAALALAWMWTLSAIESMPVRIALTLVLTVGLGAGLEAYQTRVPGRFATITDVILNTLGSVVGVILAAILL